MRLFQWMILLSIFSAKALWADESTPATDYSIKQFIKELHENISLTTKRHYMQIKSVTNTVIDAFPIGKWLSNSRWELDLMSHRIPLNIPPKTTFDDTMNATGMSLMTINRTWNTDNFTYRIGVGAISAYQDARNIPYSFKTDNGLLPTFGRNDFSFGGIASQSSIHTRIRLQQNIFLTIAGKLIYANSETSSSGIDINQRSVHLLFGLDGLF